MQSGQRCQTVAPGSATTDVFLLFKYKHKKKERTIERKKTLKRGISEEPSREEARTRQNLWPTPAQRRSISERVKLTDLNTADIILSCQTLII